MDRDILRGDGIQGWLAANPRAYAHATVVLVAVIHQFVARFGFRLLSRCPRLPLPV